MSKEEWSHFVGQYFVGDPSRVMQLSLYNAMVEAMSGKTEAF